MWLQQWVVGGFDWVGCADGGGWVWGCWVCVWLIWGCWVWGCWVWWWCCCLRTMKNREKMKDKLSSIYIILLCYLYYFIVLKVKIKLLMFVVLKNEKVK